MTKSIDELLQENYWIIDILPKQVPKDSAGQYFAIEEYFLKEPQLSVVKEKHLSLLLKLNCYLDFLFEEEQVCNPKPEQMAAWVRERYLNIRVKDSLLVSQPDETYLVLYDPDADLLEMVRTLAAAEGLFVWQP